MSGAPTVEDARASGLDGAWAALVIEQRPQIQIEAAISELTQCCVDGTISTFDGRVPINPDLWKNWPDEDDPGHAGYGPLQIELREGAPFILPRCRYGVSLDIRFSPADVMRRFRPNWEHRNLDEAAANAESLAGLRQRRTRVANWFNRHQERTALEKRVWLCLTEVAEEFARKKGAFTVDDGERAQALEALRSSILARKFSCVLCLHPSGNADFHFDPDGAAVPGLFNPIAGHLWIRYQDCVAWSGRHGRELPHRLRREQPSTAPLGTEDDTGSGHQDKGSIKLPGRQPLQERPVGKNGRTIVVTAAWDAIGLHPEWGTHGMPPHWSEEKAGIEVNKHLRMLIRQGKIDPNAYPLKPNSKSEWEISADSVDCALVPRRLRRA